MRLARIQFGGERGPRRARKKQSKAFLYPLAAKKGTKKKISQSLCFSEMTDVSLLVLKPHRFAAEPGA